MSQSGAQKPDLISMHSVLSWHFGRFHKVLFVPQCPESDSKMPFLMQPRTSWKIVASDLYRAAKNAAFQSWHLKVNHFQQKLLSYIFSNFFKIRYIYWQEFIQYISHERYVYVPLYLCRSMISINTSAADTKFCLALLFSWGVEWRENHEPIGAW